MAKGKTVQYIPCPCGKRGFEDERLADKALGRAQTKRNRAGDRAGSRRGIKREGRYYLCDRSDLYHLTNQSHASYNGIQGQIDAVRRRIEKAQRRLCYAEIARDEREMEKLRQEVAERLTELRELEALMTESPASALHRGSGSYAKVA